MNPPLTPEKILQTGLAFWPAKTLLSAIEIGRVHRAGARAGAFDALVGRLGLHPRSARDFLDTLVALGFLTRDGDRYANTPETDLFLDRQKPSYIGGILEMANHRLYPFWGHLTEALRTGQPQNEVEERRSGLVRGALCRSGAAEAVSRGDDRHQPRRQPDDRARVPVEGLHDVRRRRHGAGRSGRADRARQSAPAGHGLRSAGSGADLRGVRRRRSASPTG